MDFTDMPFPTIELPPLCRHTDYKMLVRRKEDEWCDQNGEKHTQSLVRYEIHCACGKEMVGGWFIDSIENLYQIEVRDRCRNELLKRWRADDEKLQKTADN